MVSTLRNNELIMRSAFGDTPVFDDQDLVGLSNSAQSMGDNESGSPFGQFGQTFLN